jgi:hypothetical protein
MGGACFLGNFIKNFGIVTFFVYFYCHKFAILEGIDLKKQ